MLTTNRKFQQTPTQLILNNTHKLPPPQKPTPRAFQATQNKIQSQKYFPNIRHIFQIFVTFLTRQQLANSIKNEQGISHHRLWGIPWGFPVQVGLVGILEEADVGYLAVEGADGVAGVLAVEVGGLAAVYAPTEFACFYAQFVGDCRHFFLLFFFFLLG